MIAVPERQLVVLLAAASFLVVLLGTWGLLAMEPDIPQPAPISDESVAKATTTRYRYTRGFYRALLVHDARSYGIETFNPDKLLQPHVYTPEYRGRYVLRPGGRGLETTHLLVTAVIDRSWVQQGDSRYRTEHLNLRIKNKSDSHLAYFVGTKLADEKLCASKGSVSHNALTIGPKETVERSECLYHKGNDLWVDRIDAMEITELGYYYVARLTPLTLGIDPRISLQHRPPEGTQYCRHVPQRDLDAAGTPEARWAAVIDFYARHNCDEYWFFSDYRRIEQALDKLLPARASGAADQSR